MPFDLSRSLEPLPELLRGRGWCHLTRKECGYNKLVRSAAGRSVWDPETLRERDGDSGDGLGPLVCCRKACHKAKRRVGDSTRRQMLGPERPEAVLPDRALYLPTFSHLLIVNKQTSLSRCSFEIQYAL